MRSVPTLNVTALNLAYLVGGVVVVEKVFSYPGFGSLLVDSLQLRDLPVIEATVLIAAFVYIAANLHRRRRRDPAQPAAADWLTMIVDAPTHLRADRPWTGLLPLWRQTPLSFRIGLIILVIACSRRGDGPVLGAVWLSQMGTGRPLSGVSFAHLFGVDHLGRDVFRRVVYGSHVVILLSLSGTLLGLAVGAVLGLLSGYVGGWLDEILQRFLETLISIPFLVLALLAIAAAGAELSGNPVLIVLRRRVRLCAAHRAHGPLGRRRPRHARLRHRGAARGEAPGPSCARAAAERRPACCSSSSRCAPATRRSSSARSASWASGCRPPTPEWGLMISENRA